MALQEISCSASKWLSPKWLFWRGHPKWTTANSYLWRIHEIWCWGYFHSFNYKHYAENPHDLILAPVPPGFYHLCKYLFLFRLSIQTHTEKLMLYNFPCLFIFLLYFSHLNLVTLVQFMKKSSWKEVLKFIVQFYWLCTWKPTTPCGWKVDEWTHSMKKK